jgi:hypothetical protein
MAAGYIPLPVASKLIQQPAGKGHREVALSSFLDFPHRSSKSGQGNLPKMFLPAAKVIKKHFETFT